MLPKFGDIRWLVCAASIFLVVGHGTGSSVTELPQCPGKCVPVDTHCELTSGLSLCAVGLKCCIEERSETSTESDSTEMYTYAPTIESEMRFRSFLDLDDAEESTGTPLSTLVYEEPLEESSSRDREPREEEAGLQCPGICMSRADIRFCGHPFPFPGLCINNETCCFSELQAFKIRLLSKQKTDTEGPDGTSEIRKILQAGTFGDLSDLHCPYVCVLRRHRERCTEKYPNYYCPGSSICCREKPSESTAPEDRCRGKCLPPHVQHMCHAPRTLYGSIDCRFPTLCCESPEETEKSNLRRTQYPLYVQDKDDQYFYVSPEGAMSQLTSLPPDAVPYRGQRVRPEITKGKIYMIEDPESTLWKNYQFQETADETRSFDPENPLDFDAETKENIGSDEILIPDEEDLEQTENSDLSDRPPCPGTCLSYFTRFMCFRNYTTYDGFHCPGRSVCCAKLSDVKEHENYLKSVYPYLQGSLRNFNPNCGNKGKAEESAESLPGEWCWQVAVLDSENHYVCGGALIDNSWVLTTAQCVEGFFKQNQQLFVRAGVYDLSSVEDNAVSQTLLVENTYLHYKYDATTLDNDIALLKLQNPFNLNANVCLACLPSKSYLSPEGKTCTLTGYGFISRDGGISLKITEAKITLVHDIDCISNVTEILSTLYILPASSFCGNHEKEYCQGSAGNPLVCKVDGHYELTGLVSWGVGCQVEDAPGVYVKIPAFMGWINQVLAVHYQLYSETQSSD